MLGQGSQRILQKLFATLGTGERDLEQERKRLCRYRGFSIHQAFDRLDYDLTGKIGVSEIQDYLYQNQITHFSDDEVYDLIKYFSCSQYLTPDSFQLIFLSCEDKQLRRMALETRSNGPLATAVDIAIVTVLKQELILQRNLDNLKLKLQNQPDFSFNAAFNTLDMYNQGNITADDIRDFLRQNGHFCTEREIDGILRRLDTTGDAALNFSELSLFLQVNQVPARELELSKSPIRQRQMQRQESQDSFRQKGVVPEYYMDRSEPRLMTRNNSGTSLRMVAAPEYQRQNPRVQVNTSVLSNEYQSRSPPKTATYVTSQSYKSDVYKFSAQITPQQRIFEQLPIPKVIPVVDYGYQYRENSNDSPLRGNRSQQSSRSPQKILNQSNEYGYQAYTGPAIHSRSPQKMLNQSRDEIDSQGFSRPRSQQKSLDQSYGEDDQQQFSRPPRPSSNLSYSPSTGQDGRTRITSPEKRDKFQPINAYANASEGAPSYRKPSVHIDAPPSFREINGPTSEYGNYTYVDYHEPGPQSILKNPSDQPSSRVLRPSRVSQGPIQNFDEPPLVGNTQARDGTVSYNRPIGQKHVSLPLDDTYSRPIGQKYDTLPLSDDRNSYGYYGSFKDKSSPEKLHNETEMLTAVHQLCELEQQIENYRMQLAKQPDFNVIDAYELFDEAKKGFIHIRDLKVGLDKLGAGVVKKMPSAIFQNKVKDAPSSQESLQKEEPQEQPLKFFYSKVKVGKSFKITPSKEQVLPPSLDKDADVYLGRYKDGETMWIGTIHYDKKENSKFEYFKNGKKVVLEKGEEVEVLQATEKDNYKWTEVTAGQKVQDQNCLEFLGNQDDHFYVTAVIDGKLYHQCALLNKNLEIVQPNFEIDKKQKQPNKFMVLCGNEKIVSPKKERKMKEDPNKFFSYKPIKIGKNLLIEEDPSYVVPNIQTNQQDIYFGRYTDPKDKKEYMGAIISDQKTKASSFVYSKGTAKEGEVQILCSKDLTNYSWEQAKVGEAPHDKALQLKGNIIDSFYTVGLLKGTLYPGIATCDKKKLLKNTAFGISANMKGKFQILCQNQLGDSNAPTVFIWEKLEPLQKEELEKYEIFLNAYDDSGDRRLTMNEFKDIILSRDPQLREEVIKREPEIEGNFGENDFGDTTTLLLKKLWQACLNVEITAMEIKNSEFPLKQYNMQHPGPLSQNDIRQILLDRGILNEDKQVVFSEEKERANTIKPYEKTNLASPDKRNNTMTPETQLKLDVGKINEPPPKVSKFKGDDIESINDRESKQIDIDNLDKSMQSEKKEGIKVMHWNVMSDSRAQKDYQGKVPAQVLQWKSRSPLIIEEIKRVDPDVFGLCDIDSTSILVSELTKLGYAEFSKTREKITIAVFYKKAKFQLVQNKFYQYFSDKKEEEKYSDKTDRSVVSNPPAKEASEYFIYSHIKSKSDPNLQLVFVETQIIDQVDFKLLQLHKFFKKKQEQLPTLPMIIAGTLNQTPSNMTKLEQEFVDLHGLQEQQDDDLKAIGQTNKYPAFTMQTPEEGIHLKTVDYMFVAKKFTDEEKLTASQISALSPGKPLSDKKANYGIFKSKASSSGKKPEGELKMEVLRSLIEERSLIPSKKNPSDHLGIAYEVTFN